MKIKPARTLKIKEFDDLVNGHKLKEVSPPDEAKRDTMISGGKSTMTIQQATAKWFKTAKEQNPSQGFLVNSETLDPKEASKRDMLYRGKSKKVKE